MSTLSGSWAGPETKFDIDRLAGGKHTDFFNISFKRQKNHYKEIKTPKCGKTKFFFYPRLKKERQLRKSKCIVRRLKKDELL